MKKIIIVDDDPAIQNAIGLIFDPALFEVRIYPGAEDILSENYDLPDIFILDRQLSGINGLDLCRHLKAGVYTKHIPVIMLSASPDIINAAANAGADGAVEKPFKMKQLRDVVFLQLR